MANTTVDSLENLLENVAAVSAEFHSEPIKYGQFYNDYADALSGFPGIWKYVATAGQAFSEAEAELIEEWVDGWIESVQAYVEEIRDNNGVLAYASMKVCACNAIRTHGLRLRIEK